MLIDKLRKYRRAVSPVVATLFLFAIILAAIAVSLGIIYPQVQELNDQIEVESAGSTLLSLDAEIQTLILNGVNSKITKTLDNGQTGYFYLDRDSTIALSLFEGGSVRDNFSLIHPRIRIQQVLETNYIQQGSYGYLKGRSRQSLLFLNSTNSDSYSWSILNQSRPATGNNVYTSLSYRNLVKSTRSINDQKLQMNVTIKIQMVNMTTTGRTGVGTKNPQITIFYDGVSRSSTGWYNMNASARLQAISTLSDQGATQSTEYPLNVEAPVEATTDFFVKIEFLYHKIRLQI